MCIRDRTYGALSVGGREKYKTPFQPLLPVCVEVPFGDAQALEQALEQHKCAAVILEPIQGEAGVIIPPDGYLKKVRELTKAHDVLMILDEVQTGFGRTGKMFACEHENVVPDIMCLAKALGGGVMPIGATVTTRKIWERAYGGLSKALLHTSTFGGGGRACAAGLLTLSLIHICHTPVMPIFKGNARMYAKGNLTPHSPIAAITIGVLVSPLPLMAPFRTPATC